MKDRIPLLLRATLRCQPCHGLLPFEVEFILVECKRVYESIVAVTKQTKTSSLAVEIQVVRFVLAGVVF
jgi:hypothetical protein